MKIFKEIIPENKILTAFIELKDVDESDFNGVDLEYESNENSIQVSVNLANKIGYSFILHENKFKKMIDGMQEFLTEIQKTEKGGEKK